MSVLPFSFTDILKQNYLYLILLFFVLFVTATLKSAWFKGVMGELFVKFLAKLFLSKDKYHAVHNITLPTRDGTTQIDHVYVSRYGVFWEIVDVTSGGQSIAFYFYPDFDEAVKVTCVGFQCDVETTAKAAGAAFTLMSLSQLSFFLHSKGKDNAAAATADVYHELRGYIFTSGEFSKEERTAIYKITD